MSSTVTYGSMEVTSNSDSAQTIADSLSPSEDSKATPEILVDKGQPVDAEAQKVSEAAAELGKRGGKAAAEARKEAKDATTADEGAVEGIAEGDAPAIPDEKPLGKPRHDPRARVQEATREAKEAREEARALQVERDNLARELQAARTPQQAQQGPPKPRRDHFASQDEYEDARDAYVRATTIMQVRQEMRQEQAQQSWQAHLQAQATGLHKSLAAGSKQDALAFMETVAPEIREAVPASMLENPNDATGENFLADHLVQFPETAHQLMRYLTDNPQELQRISALQSPRLSVRELGKIEARLEAAPTATSTRPTISKANPPVRPVTASPNIGMDSEDLDEDAPLSAFVQRFGQRELKKSGR